MSQKKVIRIEIIMEDKTSGERSLHSLEEDDANKVFTGMEILYNQLERFKTSS